MNKETLRQHLEGASASLEMALQEIEELENRDIREWVKNESTLQEWEKEFLSDTTVRVWGAQRKIDNIMKELGELP